MLCLFCALYFQLGVRAVPFKSVGGGGGGRRNGRFFEGGEGPNSELIFPIRLHIISGRRGGGANFNYLPFLPPTTLLNGTALSINRLKISFLKHFKLDASQAINQGNLATLGKNILGPGNTI